MNESTLPFSLDSDTTAGGERGSDRRRGARGPLAGFEPPRTQTAARQAAERLSYRHGGRVQGETRSRTYGARQEARGQSAYRVAHPRRGGRKRQVGTVGAAVRRHRATHQRDLRGLKAGTCGQRLAPRVSVSGAGKLLNPGLPGIEPNAPQLAATTASAASPTLPPRCRSRPATLAPPQDAYQLQLCRATGAISPRFPISPALAHQHPRHPARICRNQSFQ